jgi:SAM-dependent methyltransferase
MRQLQFFAKTALALAVVAVAALAVVAADDKKDDDLDREPDVIFVPTPQAVVEKMLEMAKVTKKDLVYDLGCGDGRIPLTAARKYGCKAKGFDINPERIKDSMANWKKEKKEVQDLVKIERKDIFKLDISDANVITLYLLPTLNVKLVPQLKKLKPGSRIVSHAFDMRGYKPDKRETVTVKDDDGNERPFDIYLWTIPLKEDKDAKDD